MAWRAISDSVPHSESLAGLTDGAERLYWRMVAVSDWWGRLEGKPRKVKAKTMPMVKRTDAQIARQLVELVEAGRILVYESEGEPFVQIVDFDKHQPTEYIRKRGKASKFPEPPANGQQAWHFPELLRPRTNHSHKEVEVEVEVDEEEKRTTNLARKNRAKDELWDTLVQELGPVETETERGRRNKALKQLRDIGATPSLVHQRCDAYRRHFPEAALTATALVANWSHVNGPTPHGTKLGPRELMELANRKEPLQ